MLVDDSRTGYSVIDNHGLDENHEFTKFMETVKYACAVNFGIYRDLL